VEAVEAVEAVVAVVAVTAVASYCLVPPIARGSTRDAPDVHHVPRARHVIGYHSTQETRVQNASDDVSGNIGVSQPERERAHR
jgi:hypothetical protein